MEPHHNDSYADFYNGKKATTTMTQNVTSSVLEQLLHGTFANMIQYKSNRESLTRFMCG